MWTPDWSPRWPAPDRMRLAGRLNGSARFHSRVRYSTRLLELAQSYP